MDGQHDLIIGPLLADDAWPNVDASVGRAPGMTRVGGQLTLQSVAIGLVGCGLGALATWRTGLLAAIPIAVGLTALAVSDATARRLPRRTFALTMYAALIAGAVDVARTGRPTDAFVALVIAELVGLCAFALWAIMGGLAFGDVKLLALAAVIPAWRSPNRVGTLLVVAVLVSFGMVIVRWRRQGYAKPGGSIAFGPPVLVGWIIASVTA